MSDSPVVGNLSKSQRDLIMFGLALALFAACFDGTVTSTCGPVIAQQFSATGLLPWLTTGYLLAETVVVPLAGKMSDLYGRKKILIVGLTLFGAASLVAGFSWDMYTMIIARALQGAGGGILIPVATAAVSDLYNPEERGKIQGILGALYGVGMGLGPFVGGFFASLGIVGPFHGWQFAFLINIPIVLFVIYVCRHEFPTIVSDKKPVIDIKGAILISTTLILFVFFFENLGTIGIVSIASIVFILAIISVLKLFNYVESKAEEPIMAPNLFENPTVLSASILLFLLGFAMVGDELFMGMYLQKVTGHTASESGLFILCMVVGMIITSSIGGALLNKTGTKPWIVAGPIFMCIGFYMFSLITPAFDPVMFCLSEFMFGLGAGCLVASLMVAVQASCEHKDVGMTTSAVNLMRNIGSTIGTAVLTLIVNGAIFVESNEKGYSQFADVGIGILDQIGLYGAEMDAVIRQIFTDGVATAFGFVSLILLAAVYFGLKFKIVKMDHTHQIARFTEELTKEDKDH